MKIEFHVHTRYSSDSILNKYFILLMCKIKKIAGIAITDHNEIKGALKYKKFLEKHKVNVIVGEEIFTTEGEIIGLFLKEKIEPFLSPKETIKQIREQSGLVYIPHPYDIKRKKSVLKEQYIQQFSNQIDLIEVHNGRNISNDYSTKQKNIADRYNILSIIGSDAHTFFELGRNYVTFENTISKENLRESIKNAKFVTKECIGFSHIYTKYIKLLKMLLRGDINGLYRVINRRCKRKEY